MMNTPQKFALTRSIYPYSLYIILCVLIFVITFFAAIVSHDIGPILMAFVVTAFMAAMMYPDTRYRIYWEGNRIRQVSANGDETVIGTDDIIRVAQERSALESRLRFLRPADRITIYGKSEGNEKYIDVSLRHFTAGDIKKLMHVIHDRHPDLTIPPKWL
jgi:hypothetical protein